MRTQKQKDKECMLATIATLAGLPLGEVSERARRLQGGLGFNTPGASDDSSYWGTTLQLVEELGLHGLVPTSRLEYRAKVESFDSWGDMFDLLPDNDEWGSIVYEQLFNAHIVAFKKGYVYDSGIGHRMPVREWFRMVYDGFAAVKAVWSKPCE